MEQKGRLVFGRPASAWLGRPGASGDGRPVEDVEERIASETVSFLECQNIDTLFEWGACSYSQRMEVAEEVALHGCTAWEAVKKLGFKRATTTKAEAVALAFALRRVLGTELEDLPAQMLRRVQMRPNLVFEAAGLAAQMPLD